MSVQANRAVSSSMNQFILHIDVAISKLSILDLIVYVLTAIADSFITQYVDVKLSAREHNVHV